MSLILSFLGDTYAVCQLPEDAAPPAWAFAGEFWSVTRAPGELSVVCAAANVPDDVRAEKEWAALRLHGPFEFTLTGILASVLNPLRDAGVGIFVLSTFDTDYVLVAQSRLPEAVTVLRASGHTVMD
ncbi:ACT domain-containing protein [Deinococcus frigens]|uniref:ACT domain-containing protein n=1 Tax=Deinococcus frigens TaxID=249403 RepID=UPI0004957B72|nr:ACT domain-containing protein [Deinococcus frigens]